MRIRRPDTGIGPTAEPSSATSASWSWSLRPAADTPGLRFPHSWLHDSVLQDYETD